MNVEIGAEAALFLEKEYINGIFVAVCAKLYGDFHFFRFSIACHFAVRDCAELHSVHSESKKLNNRVFQDMGNILKRLTG
jgi:hypothetical protein